MLLKSTQKSSELSRGPRHRLFQSPLRHTWQLGMMTEEVSKKMRLTEVNCSDLWVTSCCIHWLKAITLHYKVAGNGLRWEMVISSAVTQGRDWYLGPWVMGSDERMKWCDKFLNAVLNAVHFFSILCAITIKGDCSNNGGFKTRYMKKLPVS